MSNSSKAPATQLYEAILERYPATPAYLLAALEDVQAAMGWVPGPLAGDLAAAFGADSARLEALLGMQEAFRSTPVVANAIGVCVGAVCSAHGGGELLAGLRRRAEGTGVSVETVHCQGGCDHPPVAVCGRERISDATVASVWQAVQPGD